MQVKQRGKTFCQKTVSLKSEGTAGMVEEETELNNETVVLLVDMF
jgi:hypothetical protein